MKICIITAECLQTLWEVQLLGASEKFWEDSPIFSCAKDTQEKNSRKKLEYRQQYLCFGLFLTTTHRLVQWLLLTMAYEDGVTVVTIIAMCDPVQSASRHLQLLKEPTKDRGVYTAI